MKWQVVLGVALCWVTFAFAEEAAKAPAKRAQQPKDTGAADGDKDKFLLGAAKTITYTSVVTSTSEVFRVCSTVADTATTCGSGRRKRRSFRQDSELDSDLKFALKREGEIAPSIGSSKSEDSPTSEDQKAFYQVYSRVTSTTTLTVLSTNTGTSIVLSFACSPIGGIAGC